MTGPAVKQPIRVLLVEDNPGDTRHIVNMLQDVSPGDFDIECVNRLEPALARLGTARVDLVLLDLGLPDSTGLETFERARRGSTTEPIVVISGLDDEQMGVQAVRAGAQDYLVKGRLESKLLVQVIRHAIERKRAETALASSEAHYRTILEHVADAVFVADAQGRFIDVNPRACEVSGYSREELLHLSASDTYLPEDQPAASARLAEVTMGRATMFQRRLRRKDGTVVQIEGGAVQLPDARVVATFRDITERTRSEAQIRESELRFRQLTENMNEVFFVVDAQYREMVYISPAYAKIWGKSCESLYADPLSFIEPVPAEDRDRLSATIGQAQQGKNPDEVEFRVNRPDGTIRWVLARTVPVRNERGEVYRIAGVALDITERKRADEALVQRARLAELNAAVGVAVTQGEFLGGILQRCAEALVRHLDAAFARIWTLNDQTNVLELQASAGFYTHLDGPHSRVPVGQFKIGLIAAERRPHLTNAVIGDPRVHDQEWAKREGMVAFAGYPLIVADRVVGVMAMFARHPFSDFVQQALASIADAVALGIARKGSEELILRLTQAVEQGPAGVMITDTAGTIQYVNPRFTELTGYTAAEAIGKTPRMFKSGKTPPEVYRELWGKITAGEEWRGLMQNQRKDGSVWWNAASISPVRDTHGTVTHFLAIQQDVSGQRELEEQFRQAQKMEAVGRLAGGVAHDFNNLLTVISSYSELLLGDLPEEDEARRDDLSQIKKAAGDAAALTRQLLAFSRQQVIEARDLDLNAIVTGAGKMLQRVIGDDITLALVLAPDLGWVKADPGQIEQVIMNLAVNARDAMPQGGKMTIETANADLDVAYVAEHSVVQPGQYVQLVVSDTGEGMNEEVKRHIFEPFFTTKEQGKGTGLGLATVYGIVKQNRGFVWVHSEPGQGATFKIYLPRLQEADVVVQPPKISPPPRGTETVLLAEDSAAVRAVARQVLERHGYTVLEAPNGQTALDIVAQLHGPIHLLLTDVVMPEMSGRQLADRLTAQRPEIKVLYVSGYTDDSIVRHGVLEAEIAYLQKPFTPEGLARKVREVLDGEGRRA